MRRTRLLRISLLAVTPILLLAQASGPTLTLSQAHELALKNHPRILGSEANYQRADQLTREARAAYYPALNGEVTGAQAELNSRLGAGALNDPRLFNHFGAGLTLSQLITDSGRTPNLVANARLSAQARRADYQAARDEVVAAVDQAYFEVLLSIDLQRVAEQTIATRQTLVDQISELARNKLRSGLDLSFAQVNLADARLMRLRAQNRLEASYATLADALGTDRATRYQLSPEPPPPEPATSPEPLIEQAIQSRPELASLRLQSEAARKFVAAEADLKRPTVSLSAVGGGLPYINQGNVSGEIPGTYEAVAINIQVPIFNGHLFSARREAAEYQARSTDQQQRELRNRISRDVRTAWGQARTAYAAIQTARELMLQADQALDFAQRRYDLGLSSIVELSQAQLGLTAAQVESSSATYEYEQAASRLQFVLGQLR